MKISAVYRIKNKITGDFYIGSSKNVKNRWANHCCPSRWAERPNIPMYQDMQKYGIENFVFTYVCFVEPTHLKQVEQELIELLQPTYNQSNAYGRKYNVNRYVKDYYKRNNKKVRKYVKDHYRKNRQHFLSYHKVYDNRPCLYNGTEYKFRSLLYLFKKQGFENPTQEAKKYLIKKDTD